METPHDPQQWRPIAGWPAYEVSIDGAVRSVDREWTNRSGARTARMGKVIATRLSRAGYRRVTLSDETGGRLVTAAVHRLVAIAFHGQPPSPIHQVDHIDRNRDNNHASNLRWVTPRQNHRTVQDACGSRNGGAVLTENDVLRLRHMYDSEDVPVSAIAAEFGVSRQTVTKIGKRHGWTHV